MIGVNYVPLYAGEACDVRQISPLNTLRQEEVEGSYDVQVKGPQVNIMAKLQSEMRARALKQVLELRTGIPHGAQRLVFQGKQLNDTDSIIGVVREGRIELALGAIGGVGSPRPRDLLLARPALPDPPSDPWMAVAEGFPDLWRKAADELAKDRDEREAGQIR